MLIDEGGRNVIILKIVHIMKFRNPFCLIGLSSIFEVTILQFGIHMYNPGNSKTAIKSDKNKPYTHTPTFLPRKKPSIEDAKVMRRVIFPA